MIQSIRRNIIITFDAFFSEYSHTMIGFQCGRSAEKLCISYDHWCTGERDHQERRSYIKFLMACPELIRTFKSERLCSNATFWSNRPCPTYQGNRCSGNNPGQCPRGFTTGRRQVRSAAIPIRPCEDLQGICKDNSEVQKFILKT